MNAVRSALYVPGDREDMLAGSRTRGADALIVDLEDAVAPAAKDAARGIVADFLATLPPAAAGQIEILVRVNPGIDGLGDIEAAASPALTGFVLAKAQSAEDVVAADDAVLRAEHRLGLPPGLLGLCPLLESAAAVLSAREIATASARVRRMQIGEADLRADIGATLGSDERELLFVRSAVVLASAAAGIGPPMAAADTNISDLQHLRSSTEALKRMGFSGRACIHPAQCDVVNLVFTPVAADLRRARELVDRYETALASGGAVFTDEDGRMVDLAVIRQARRLLGRT